MEFFDQFIHAITELHPLHPMLVHFPIGLTGGGALFILLALWTRKTEFELAAFYNIALASVATLIAGLAGLYDNELNYGGEAPNAMWKIILAGFLLILTTATTVLRWRNPSLFQSKARSLYTVAYLLSFIMALVLAFLGGVILYGF